MVRRRNGDKKIGEILAEAIEKVGKNGTVTVEEGKSLDDVMDEGLFTALLGGVAGSTIGPAIMKAICHILGIDPNGTLGKLLTSSLVMGALGAELSR